MVHKLDRRRFLRTSAEVIGVGGATLLAGCPEKQSITPVTGAGPTPSAPPSGPAAADRKPATPTDGKVGQNRLMPSPVEGIEAVIARDKPREELVTAAFEAYGGISAFVQKGDRVVIKPNLGWAMDPAMGVDTHPEIVATLVKLCKEAGAAEIIVVEHSCDDWTAVKLLSGVPEAAETAGAHVIGWLDERLYKQVDFPAGKSITSDMVAKDVLECDVLLNVPKFKHHSATEICGAMKNQLGLILRPQTYHQTKDQFTKDPNLHVNIADLASAVRPTLNVVDLTNCCVVGGPKGGTGAEVKEFNTLIVSTDIVACDSLGTEILGICKLEDVPHIRIASEERKLGNMLTVDDHRVKIV
ncbi:MAG: DUF362 domain-containing protein [Candidatus Zipacnadales bacterium]